MWILIAQRIILDFLLSVVYFPLWWYSRGVRHVLLYCFNLLQSGNDFLAPGLWLKNIFVPMFGQSDWQGRIVSVFMRVINIIFRAIGLLFVATGVLLIFVAWLVWPLFLSYMLFISF